MGKGRIRVFNTPSSRRNSLKLKLLELPCDGGSSGATGDLGRKLPDRIVLGVSGKLSSWEDAVEKEGDEFDVHTTPSPSSDRRGAPGLR